MTRLPTVTVLIPAVNEEADIERCLQAVLAQDHPHDRMEIVLVDGGSSDATVDTATRVLEEGDVDWKIIDNPVGTTPSNLNAGLSVASGEILCRIDARSTVPSAYVRRCADLLRSRPELTVVGGTQVAEVVGNTAMGTGIARALNNRWLMGGAAYRGRSSGPADTVYLGAFRTGQLRAAGGWDERMRTNQDFELNRRMAARGTVWYDADLRVGYRPRRTLVDLARQYFRFGRWKVRYWRRTGDRPLPRQAVRLVAVPVVGLGSLLAIAGADRRSRALLTVGGLATAVVFEWQGADAPEATPVGHLLGVLSCGVVATSWTLGLLVEMLRPRGQGA